MKIAFLLLAGAFVGSGLASTARACLDPSCNCMGSAATAAAMAVPSASWLEMAQAEPDSSAVTMHVFNFSFSANSSNAPVQPDLIIDVGQSVNWQFDDGFHTTTSVAGSVEQWSSGFVAGGSGLSFAHTFTHAGTFPYYCQAHGFDNGDGTAGGMAGTITATLAGDCNLDFKVDFNDVLTLEKRFGQTTGATWQEGDFNRDGAITSADVQLLFPNYHKTVTGSFAGDMSLAQSLVPEPTASAILMGCAIVSRRRRR